MAVTIEVPGGEVVLLDAPGEMTPRRRREIEIVASRIGRKIEVIQNASRILCDGDVVVDQSEEKDAEGELKFTGGDVEVSEREFRLMNRLNDAVAWAMLKSWTLPQPLPASPEEFLDDCPIAVYDVLREKAAEISAGLELAAAQFGVDGVEDTASPTGG
jgi:hypothetical protein